MVAQVNREMFSDTLLTPWPDPSDSEEVLRGLERARDLEARGKIHEAVRCLRRAADAAERQGTDARVLVLARAAADLTNAVGPVPWATVSTSPLRSQPTLVEDRVPERKVRIGSVRVALAGSMEESSFVVHRLAAGQPLPDGMTEAILVLTGDVEGRVEIETTLRVMDRSTAKS
ncbi:MAG TPA: hypothetical protein VK540_03875 [Polyangiaceae bacterium]|jgi:hypothetical protein|nr:hypothetical protein [Polyangiaceae bacterium]